jgi:hypothetical protein
MTSRDVPTSDSRRITRSLPRAVASRTSGATDSTNAGSVLQRTNVRRTGSHSPALALCGGLQTLSLRIRCFRQEPKRRRTIFCADRRKVLRGAYHQRRITTPALVPVSGLCIRDFAAIRRTNQRLQLQYRKPEGRGGPHPPHLQIGVDYRRTGTDTTT